MHESNYPNYDEVISELEEPQEGKEKTSGKQLRLTWLMAILVVLLVISGFYLTQKHDDVPSQLIGVWKTNSPQYADRFVEIRPVTISFGTGSGTELTGFIRSVQATQQDGKIMYTLGYTANGADSYVCMYYSYSSGASPTLQLKNQEKVVWRKE